MFLFCYALLCVLSSFAIILKRKRDMAALLLLPCGCLIAVYVLWLFLAVLLFGLQCVIVVFPDHTHLMFYIDFSGSGTATCFVETMFCSTVTTTITVRKCLTFIRHWSNVGL